jgi:membrane associated rhomboid family serine protease
MTRMNWIAILLVAAMGFLIAGSATVLLSIRSPNWSSRKRVLMAAMVAPVLILVGVLVGITMVSADANDMSDLARAALISIGVRGAVIAFAIGLAASWLTERALKSS